MNKLNKKNLKKGKQIYLYEDNKYIINSYHFDMSKYYNMILNGMNITSYEEFISKYKNDKVFKLRVKRLISLYFDNNNIKIIPDKTYNNWYFIELANMNKIEYKIRRIIYNLKNITSNMYSYKKIA